PACEKRAEPALGSTLPTADRLACNRRYLSKAPLLRLRADSRPSKPPIDGAVGTFERRSRTSDKPSNAHADAILTAQSANSTDRHLRCSIRECWPMAYRDAVINKASEFIGGED